MLKVIIADDERMQRAGIAKHVRWQDFGMTVSGLASDGVEALELIRTCTPDVLITDIKMPRMNGLELAKQAKAAQPGLKVIIISGYDEFEYARTAVEIDAFVFLLKPVQMNKLQQELERIGNVIAIEKRTAQEMNVMRHQLEESKPLLVDRFIKHVLYGFLKDPDLIQARAEFLQIHVPDHGYHLLMLQTDYSADQNVTEAGHHLNFLYMQQDLDRHFAHRHLGIPIHSKENEFVLILFHQGNVHHEPQLQIDHIRRLFVHIDDCLTISVSNRKTRLNELFEAYKEVETAARQKCYVGKGKTIYYADTRHEQTLPVTFDHTYEQLVQAISIGNKNQVSRLLHHLFVELSESNSVPMQAVKLLCFRLMGDMYKIFYEMNEKVESVYGDGYSLWNKVYSYDTLPEVRDGVRDMVQLAVDHIFSKNSRKHNSIVTDIIRMLEERYREPISLEEISRHVYLTPNYISNIFKEHVGESITDYLTKTRMKHARRLLADPMLRIYEVAEQTGYNSTSYFSVVFKSTFGFSPKEYRDHLLEQP